MAAFTQKLIAVYKERIPTTSFLRSFFPTVESLTRYITFEVQRMNGEPVAVDVYRGDKGNYNTADKSTVSMIDPPFYNEYFNMSELDLYDRLVGQENISEVNFAAAIQQAADKLQKLIDKIERSYERQCSQVLQTGIVTVASGDNIDYNRKADSKVDLTSTTGYWTTGSVDPISALQTGCNFLRTEGGMSGAVVNMIAGDLAWDALVNNTTMQNKYDIKNYDMGMLMAPQRTAVGSTYKGRIAVNNYLVDCWGYPQFYTDPTTGTKVPYIDTENVVLLPQVTNFKLAFGAVPQLLNNDGSRPQQGAYLVQRWRSEEQDAEFVRVKSAGVAVPVAVDQIYTMKAVATPSGI